MADRVAECVFDGATDQLRVSGDDHRVIGAKHERDARGLGFQRAVFDKLAKQRLQGDLLANPRGGVSLGAG